MGLEIDDFGFDGRALVEVGGEAAIGEAWDVTDAASMRVNGNGVGVVGIGGFAFQAQGLFGTQDIAQRVAVVVNPAGEFAIEQFDAGPGRGCDGEGGQRAGGGE